MTATAGKWPVLVSLLNKWARRLGWQFTKDTVEQNAPHGTSCRVERFAPLNISGGAEQ